MNCEEVCREAFASLISRRKFSDSEVGLSSIAEGISQSLIAVGRTGKIRDAIFNTFLRMLSQLAQVTLMDSVVDSRCSNERFYIIQALLVCLQSGEHLILHHCLAFGDLLDLYMELLDVSDHWDILELHWDILELHSDNLK